jgi:hypothetical protein
MREICRTEANGQHLQNCLVNKLRCQGIVRICLNRLSFAETRGVKRFSDRRISQRLLIRGRFKFEMDRALSTPWWPETSKLIHDLFGWRPGAKSGDFFGPTRIVFRFVEESSSMTVHMI